MKNGFDEATACSRIAVGCHWMCVPGRECPMNDTVKINIAKVLEVALLEMKTTPVPSCEELFRRFSAHLKRAVEVTAAGINLHLDHQWEVTPELVMNLMMYNTLEQGKDITQCADLFTVGVDGAGPVSYTHLDVYKRQVFHRLRQIGAAGGPFHHLGALGWVNVGQHGLLGNKNIPEDQLQRVKIPISDVKQGVIEAVPVAYGVKQRHHRNNRRRQRKRDAKKGLEF